MTLDDFDEHPFCINTLVIYDGVKRKVASVDFKERLIGLEHEDEIEWVRCENVDVLAIKRKTNMEVDSDAVINTFITTRH